MRYFRFLVNETGFSFEGMGGGGVKLWWGFGSESHVMETWQAEWSQTPFFFFFVKRYHGQVSSKLIPTQAILNTVTLLFIHYNQQTRRLLSGKSGQKSRWNSFFFFPNLYQEKKNWQLTQMPLTFINEISMSYVNLKTLHSNTQSHDCKSLILLLHFKKKCVLFAHTRTHRQYLYCTEPPLDQNYSQPLNHVAHVQQ